MSDARLEGAILAHIREKVEEQGGTPGLVLTNYVVVAACSGWDDGGDEVTQVTVIPHGPYYAIGGLLREATIRNDADTLGLGADE